ncbi:MAG: hypothetical protein PHD56_01550 [Anaerostipes sp.]|nr:hypothetical protein [Anaerostipes sp.]
MKWKEGVVIEKQGKHPQVGYIIRLGEKEKRVNSEHEYLLEKIASGVEDDQELIGFIVKKENIPEVAAAFGFAGFLIEYADFIAPDTSHYIIG